MLASSTSFFTHPTWPELATTLSCNWIELSDSMYCVVWSGRGTVRWMYVAFVVESPRFHTISICSVSLGPRSENARRILEWNRLESIWNSDSTRPPWPRKVRAPSAPSGSALSIKCHPRRSSLCQMWRNLEMVIEILHLWQLVRKIHLHLLRPGPHTVRQASEQVCLVLSFRKFCLDRCISAPESLTDTHDRQIGRRRGFI